MLRVVILTLSTLLGVFIVAVVVMGILIETGVVEDPDDTEAAAEPEQVEPTTTTTTTTRPPTTTTEAPLTVEECLEWERAESNIVYGIGDSLGEMAAAMAVGDADMAHSWYWHAKGQREVLYFTDWLAECGHYNPDGAARAAADYNAAEEAWEGVERICRDAFEPLGLAC